MSATELLTIVFGLFLGYWVVSNLLAKGGEEQQRTPPPAPDPVPAEPAAASASEAPAPAWHEVLGVVPGASTEEVRRAYRTLSAQYDPEKVALLGEELRAAAERKSREIDDAYRLVMEARGLAP